MNKDNNRCKKFILTVSVLLLVTVFSNTAPASAEPLPEAKSLFKRALDLNDRHDYATALNYLMKAYQISPEILAENDNGLLDNATAFLKARVTQKPNDAEGHFQLAELLILRGVTSEAEKHYREVVKLAPGGPLALLAKGELNKIQQNNQQMNIQISKTPPVAVAKGDSKEVKRLKAQIESLKDDIARLRKKLKQQKINEKKKMEKFEQMAKDYKKLKKDSALWKLSYIKHMSSPAVGY